MKLTGDQRDWQDLAEMDPMWAILSSPGKQHGAWDPDEFAASGRVEIEALMTRAERFGLPRRRSVALDFGCGTGRLTRPLAERFERYVGLDISKGMLADARGRNGDVANATFVQNAGDRLASVADQSVDLVYSRIVLQHVSRRAAIRSYLREFARVLVDGGLLCCQLPSHIPPRHRLQPRPRLYGALRRVGVPTDVLYGRLGLRPIRMRFLPVGEVRRLLEGEGLRLLAIDTVPVSGIASSTYYATRG